MSAMAKRFIWVIFCVLLTLQVFWLMGSTCICDSTSDPECVAIPSGDPVSTLRPDPNDPSLNLRVSCYCHPTGLGTHCTCTQYTCGDVNNALSDPNCEGVPEGFYQSQPTPDKECCVGSGVYSNPTMVCHYGQCIRN